MQVSIYTTLSCSPKTLIDLPVADWSEIKESYIKWDTFHFTRDGKKWEEIALNNDTVDVVDWKHPVAVTVTDPATGEMLSDDDE